MAHGKKYLSTEVSVHVLEIEFVERFLEFESSLTELFYFLDHLPESLRPSAQIQRYQVKKTFITTLQAARLAQPIIKRTNGKRQI